MDQEYLKISLPKYTVPCLLVPNSEISNQEVSKGLGCSGCVLLSQMTTGKPAKVISGYKKGDKTQRSGNDL